MPEYQTSGDYSATFAPLHHTTFAYDGFDPVRQPNGKEAKTAYTRSRVVTRTVSVGTSASYDSAAGRPVVAETSASTTELYDGHGRLVEVAESAGFSAVTARYGYDVANRLDERRDDLRSRCRSWNQCELRCNCGEGHAVYD